MRKLIQVPIPTDRRIHVQDVALLTEFLDANSEALGAIANLGSFIDITKVTLENGIDEENTILVVGRTSGKGEAAGNDITPIEGKKKRSIFEYPYDLPPTFPEKPTKKKVSIIPATVETHSCAPQESCETCNGSGRCSICDARGFNRCTRCEGAGKVEKRTGNYANGNPKYTKVACPSCHGAKKVTCPACQGNKKCMVCNGTGENVCSRCDGSTFYQTYDQIFTTFETVSLENIYSPVPEVKDVLPLTKDNKVVFDDILIEWESSGSILIDKRNDAIKQNKNFSEFVNSVEEKTSKDKKLRLGRIHSKFSNIPITIIEYLFEGKEYSLYIVGENNIVCFSEIPQTHGYRTNAGIFSRFINLFTTKQRRLAFLYIAAYMFHADGSMAEEEKMLLNTMLNHISLGYEDRQKFIDEFVRELSFGEIQPYIKCIKDDQRAVIFAWQCVLQDKEIKDSEIAAFNALTDFFKIDANTTEMLKDKALRLGKMSEAQFLKEYFN